MAQALPSADDTPLESGRYCGVTVRRRSRSAAVRRRPQKAQSGVSRLLRTTENSCLSIARLRVKKPTRS